MKVHIGVKDVLGLIHGIMTISANYHKLKQADKLLRGMEECIGVMVAIE